MGKFNLLFSAEIEHLFFSDRCCRHLEWVPSASSHQLIADIGLVYRKYAEGIYFFYDQNNLDALFLAADDSREPLHLFIKAHAKDPKFMNYTQCPISNEGTVLYFDNLRAKPKARHRITLNQERYVSDKDRKKITTGSIASNLSKQDKLIAPTLILDIFIDQSPTGILGKPPNINPKRYVIRFKNRETYWKYFLLNDFAKDNLYIEDVNNQVKFDKPCAAELPGGRDAFFIRSTSPLPLVEAHQEHFQLITKNGGNDKILMKRLPVASADRLSRDTIDGQDAAVSEIFINC